MAQALDSWDGSAGQGDVETARYELQNPYHRLESGRRLQETNAEFMRPYINCKVAFATACGTGNSVNTGSGENLLSEVQHGTVGGDRFTA